jgi:hypothetical protein
MSLLKGKIFGPLIMVLGLFAGSSQAALILDEDFNDGVADGWNLNGLASVGDEVSLYGTESELALLIGTRGGVPGVASTQIFDFRPYYQASISFDFRKLREGYQSTRWVTLDFFNGAGWVQLARLSLIAANDGAQAFTVNSGLGQFSQFRFSGNSGTDKVIYASIDNVRITAVSAPQTLALFFGALVMVVFVRRAKK